MNVIGILIKPDVHERGIYEPLMQDFKALGYEVVLEQDVFLSVDDIEFLYPESYLIPAGKKSLNTYLENKKSTIVLFRVPLGCDIEKEISKLQEVKGKKELRTGLRNKYNNIQITDSEIADKTGNYYKYMMINLFHVFDNIDQLNYFKMKFVKS